MSLLRQSTYLAVIFGIILIWRSLPLDHLTVPAIGVTTFIYLLLYRFQKSQKDTRLSDLNQLSMIMLVSVVLLLVFTTGGLHSYIFFLLYFIPFALAFTLLPETVFVYLLGVLLILIIGGLGENVTESMIKIGSLGLFTPLAYFFGREYRVVEDHQQRDEEIANRISTEAANVLRDQAHTLPEENKAQLADIIHSSEELKNDEK